MTEQTLARIHMLAARDGRMGCAYCGRELPPERLVLEHVVPRTLGGPDGLHNRVLSCARCDRDKGPRTPQEWQPGRTWGLTSVDQPTDERRAGTFPAPATLRPSRRGARLTSRPFRELAFCATCQTIVKELDHARAYPGHLLVDDGSCEPQRDIASSAT